MFICKSSKRIGIYFLLPKARYYPRHDLLEKPRFESTMPLTLFTLSYLFDKITTFLIMNEGLWLYIPIDFFLMTKMLTVTNEGL